MVDKTPVPIHKIRNPNFSAIKVPKYGVIMNAIENEIPFKPMYAPLLFFPDLKDVIVDMNGKAQISPTDNKVSEITRVIIL